VRDVDDLLRRDFRQPIGLTDISRAVSIHPILLTRVYRRMRGRSLRDAVHRLRLLEASRLVGRGVVAAQVGPSVGFRDRRHLAAVSAQLPSCTPPRLRRHLRLAAHG
jgi:transcriptional regulator GlxA family with amidase domain